MGPQVIERYCKDEPTPRVGGHSVGTKRGDSSSEELRRLRVATLLHCEDGKCVAARGEMFAEIHGLVTLWAVHVAAVDELLLVII